MVALSSAPPTPRRRAMAADVSEQRETRWPVEAVRLALALAAWLGATWQLALAWRECSDVECIRVLGLAWVAIFICSAGPRDVGGAEEEDQLETNHNGVKDAVKERVALWEQRLRATPRAASASDGGFAPRVGRRRQ